MGSCLHQLNAASYFDDGRLRQLIAKHRLGEAVDTIADILMTTAIFFVAGFNSNQIIVHYAARVPMWPVGSVDILISD